MKQVAIVLLAGCLAGVLGGVFMFAVVWAVSGHHMEIQRIVKER